MNAVISNTKIYDLLNNVVNGNIENCSISVHDPNKKGEGYLGEMYFVSMRDKTSGKAIDVVVKQAFSDEKLRVTHPIRRYYLNEIRFYTKVWPRLQKIQSDAALSEPFNKVPRCFVTSSEYEHEKLVLENLKYQNFQVYEKAKTFDDEHMRFVLTQYGKLHAISFAYKLLNPEEYHEISKDLENLYGELVNIKPACEYIDYILDISLKTLDPQKDVEVIGKFKAFVENWLDIFCNKNNYLGDYSVILHGDCWSNNMMFKYNEQKQLCDLRLLDFQFCKIGTPVSDLSYCFYSGGSKKMFDQLDRYLRVYHDSLSEALKEFGFSSTNIYPFEELKKDWKNYCQPGFTMALMLWRSKLTYEDSAVDLTDLRDNDDNLTDQFAATKYDEETFNIRNRDLIVHMVENGYL